MTSANTKFTPFQTGLSCSPDSFSTFCRSWSNHSVTLARWLWSLSYFLRLTTSVDEPCAEAVNRDAESEMFLPILKGQRKMRTKANWNLFVSFFGAKRKMSPAKINQVNNICLRTLIRFFAIIVVRSRRGAQPGRLWPCVPGTGDSLSAIHGQRIIPIHARYGPLYPSITPDFPDRRWYRGLPS